MTAKAYLKQAQFLDRRIKTKLQQISSLEDTATRCTASISDMPRNPNRGGSRMAEAVEKIVDLENEIKQDVADLVALKREVMATISRLPDIQQQLLLEKRYFCYMRWEDIADDLGISPQHTYRIHGYALKEIERILKDESKCD